MQKMFTMLLISYMTLLILSNTNVAQAGVVYADRWNVAHVGILEFDEDFEEYSEDYTERAEDNISDDYQEEEVKSYGLRESAEIVRQKEIQRKEDETRKLIREEEAKNDDLHEKLDDPEYINTYSNLLYENNDLLNKIKKYMNLINLEASGLKAQGLTFSLMAAFFLMISN